MSLGHQRMGRLIAEVMGPVMRAEVPYCPPAGAARGRGRTGGSLVDDINPYP